MIGAIQGRQYSRCAIDLLKVGIIISGSQAHAPAPMHPSVCLRATQEYHGFGKGRADLKHRAILFCKVGKESGYVAFAKVWIKQQLTEGDRRNFLVRAERLSNGPARLWETAAAIERPIKSILQMN